MKLWLRRAPVRAPRAFTTLAALVLLAQPGGATPLVAQMPAAAARAAVSPLMPDAAVPCAARVGPIPSPYVVPGRACATAPAPGITTAGAALRLEAGRQAPGSYTVAGAIAGFVIGAGATYLITHAGGSTSLCDRERNQDAMSRGECIGVTALGGVAGAGIGALIGSRIRRSR